MKKLLIAILIVLCVIAVALVGSNAVVMAAIGTEGLEAYSLALQSVVSVAQYGFESIADIVGESGKTITKLFEIALEAETP